MSSTNDNDEEELKFITPLELFELAVSTTIPYIEKNKSIVKKQSKPVTTPKQKSEKTIKVKEDKKNKKQKEEKDVKQGNSLSDLIKNELKNVLNGEEEGKNEEEEEEEEEEADEEGGEDGGVKLKDLMNKIDDEYNRYPTNENIGPVLGGPKSELIQYDNNGNKIHQYFLQDQYGRYTKYIVSCSKLFKYATALIEYQESGDLTPPGGLIEKAKNKVDRNSEFMYDKSKGVTVDKAMNIVGKMLNKYLNEFPGNFDNNGTLTTTVNTRIKFKDRWEMLSSRYIDKKDFTKTFQYYFQHSIFKYLEKLKLKVLNKDADVDTYLQDYIVSPEEIHEFQIILRFMYNHNTKSFSDIDSPPFRKLLEDAKSKFFLNINQIIPITQNELRSIKDIPRESGVLLHKYIELKLKEHLNIPTDGNERSEDVYLREDEDYEQANDFINEITSIPDIQIVAVEKAMGSLKHRICGTPDLVIRDSKGVHIIIDFKRTFPTKTALSENVKRKKEDEVKLHENTFGSDYCEWASQLTALRKLYSLEGLQVSNNNLIIVFHPLFDKYKKVNINSTQNMPEHDYEPYFKDINTRDIDKDTDGKLRPTAIEFIEAIFNIQNKLLTQATMNSNV